MAEYANELVGAPMRGFNTIERIGSRYRGGYIPAFVAVVSGDLDWVELARIPHAGAPPTT